MRNSRITTRPAALAVAVVMAFGTSAVGAASLGEAQLSAQLSPATSLRAGENIDGMVPFTQPVHIEVALKMRDRAGLDSYIASAATAQRLTGVRPTLSTADVLQRHAPTEDQVKAVVDFLKSAGFTNIVVADNRMLVSADGTADVAQAAFQTSLARVTRKDGSSAIANTEPVHIPASLQGIVLAVLGLQDVHRPRVMSRVLEGPQPQAVTGHYPNEFSSIYGGTGVATAAGVTVGIITQGKLTQTIADLNSFTSAHGFPTVTTQTVNTGGTSNDTSGIGEWNLDSQDIVGMAGGQVGKIIFYNEPTLANSALTANINTVVSANAAKIINMSLGECEKDAHSDGSDAADDQLFATAVAQGQTFSISTGDFGADECQDGGVDEASNPANSPYVVAVSGTTLNASTSAWSSETVWVDSGGSQSTIEPKPSWQTLWSGSKRGVADVAFDGDPNSGAKVIVNGGTQQIGGTSLSAPIFAGMWARVLAVKGTSVGFAGPIIYQLPASDFHDITSGNNNGSTAAAGYDLATGRGSMILSSAINHIGGGGGGGNVAPVANFSFTTNALVANFTDSSSDSDGTIASRSWNFGDGGTSTATNPSHTYASAGTYSVSLTVTDDGGATNTKTSSVTVTGGGGGGGNVLQNGVAVTGLAATTGNKLNYTMVVPAGATNLKFVTSGGSGDGDLYVKFGSAPTTSSYDCRSWVSGNSETCNITTAQAGTYYVMINAYSTFSGMSLTGSYSTGGGGGGGTTLTNGVPVTGLAASSGNWTSDYTLVVPSGATNLKFQISGGSGDADLYVRLNSAPTTSSYSCRPYLSGNNESCTWSAPTPGTYHVRIRAYTTFSGVTLTPSFTP
ncbi:pre-peptidase C-terminal domain-containing protein [Dokdonella fugitiva]|uniref:Xanthomonalisin n=1 Tax=Dokdonella fugitiva TaxID=328517 RepID=A0A4R2IB31_9GAMM|nr:pre-peptidase C-terminal domain-containing protein [Dokdonella fugitiva]MBA8885207.1 xanthomonalisin [Dokdonella fugitiva]TCO41704.1 xanthomonalisin [Dokdonella fugitiva]